MLDETTDGENGFQEATTKRASSTAGIAAVPRCARRAKAVVGSLPAAIRALAASRYGCLLEEMSAVSSGNEAPDRPLPLTGRRLSVPASTPLSSRSTGPSS
jgi:hypothetical protein